MNTSIKQAIANRFPMLGKYKRVFVAFVDAISPIKKTYSQHKEDVFLLECLSKYDLAGAIYIDIGANHPTDISNTYLLYRHGQRGLIIEPNDELTRLFKKFRKRDDVLMIGCGEQASVVRFNISKTPVVSSFLRDVNTYRSMYVPILSLDTVIKNMEFSFISFLSIDVEGLTFDVLNGATNALKAALLICVEFDSDAEKDQLQNFLGTEYELLATFGCNLIFLNKKLSNQLRAKG